MKFAAFLRNVNLGRPGAPTRVQLAQAFADAGGRGAQPFQTNGTVVFESASPAAAERVLRKALGLMARSCDLAEPGCVRSLDELAPLATAPEFDAFDPGEVYELVLSFACDRRAVWQEALPYDNAQRNVRILALVDGNALSVSWKRGASPGSPNVLLERRTGSAWTSRSIGTLRRLVAKHGAA